MQQKVYNYLDLQSTQHNGSQGHYFGCFGGLGIRIGRVGSTGPPGRTPVYKGTIPMDGLRAYPLADTIPLLLITFFWG